MLCGAMMIWWDRRSRDQRVNFNIFTGTNQRLQLSSGNGLTSLLMHLSTTPTVMPRARWQQRIWWCRTQRLCPELWRWQLGLKLTLPRSKAVHWLNDWCRWERLLWQTLSTFQWWDRSELNWSYRPHFQVSFIPVSSKKEWLSPMLTETTSDCPAWQPPKRFHWSCSPGTLLLLHAWVSRGQQQFPVYSLIVLVLTPVIMEGLNKIASFRKHINKLNIPTQLALTFVM